MDCASGEGISPSLSIPPPPCGVPLEPHPSATPSRPQIVFHAILVLILGLLFGAAEPVVAQTAVRYTLDATLSPDLHHLEGTLQLEVRTPRPLDSLTLLQQDEALNQAQTLRNDVTLSRIYPHGRAAMRLDFVPPSLPPPTPTPQLGLRLYRLSSPGDPGAPLVVSGPYALYIPDRYGTAGLAHHQLTLLGSWLPLLVLPAEEEEDASTPAPQTSYHFASRSELHVHLKLRDDLTVLLDGRPLRTVPCPTLEPGARCAEGESSSATPLLRVGRLEAFALDVQASPPGPAAERADESSTAPDSVPGQSAASVPGGSSPPAPVSLYDAADRPKERGLLGRIVADALDIWKSTGHSLPTHPAPLLRTPLRRSLTVVTDDALLISDRALRVFPLTRRFHIYAVLHAIFQSWLEDDLQRIEQPEELRWVADGLAWELVEHYRSRITAGKLQLARVLAPLAFIPGIDEMLNAPRFAFAGELYDQPYDQDPLREDPRQFLSPRPGGRVLVMKMEDRYGAEKVNRAIQRKLNGDQAPFVELVAQETAQTPESLRSFLAGWLGPYPSVDYRLEMLHQTRIDGAFRTEVQVEAKALEGKLPEEPLTLEFVSPTSRQRVTVEGSGIQKVLVESPTPVTVVQLDPDRRLLEVSPDGISLRDNNRWPRKLRWLVASTPGGLDLATFKPQLVTGVYVTPPADRRWLVLSELGTDSSTPLSLTAGAYYYFGRPRDPLWRVNRVGGQLVYGRRTYAPDFLALRTGLDLNTITLPPGLDTLGLRLSYRFDTRVAGRDSTRGVSFGSGLELGHAWLAQGSGERQEGPYAAGSMGGVGLFTPHPRVIVATRAQVDAALGLTTQDATGQEGVFSLGGLSSLRGLPPGEGRGNRRYLVSLEQRLQLFEGLDFGVVTSRVRGVQTAVFVDFGAVGDRLTAMTPPLLGYGVGLRFQLEALGVRSTLVGFDLAWLEGNTGDVQSILRVSQPF